MAHENATPRPWKVDPTYLSEVQTEADETISSCWYANCEGVEVTLNGVRKCEPEESAANAALIVEAVNAYDTLRAENERLRAAVAGVIKWDKRRGYIVPYAVRDPLHAALSEAQP